MLAVLSLMACSVDASVGSATPESTLESQVAGVETTPEYTPLITPQVPAIEPTIATALEPDREAAISYIFALSRVSDEYEESLANAGVTVSVTGGDLERAIAIYGSLDRAQLVLSGLRDRVAALNSPTLGPDLTAVHELAEEIVNHELLWLNLYTAAIESGDGDSAGELIRSYYLDVPVNQLAQLHEQLQNVLAAQNIPYSEVYYQPDDFRLTILDEDYLPKTDQHLWLQRVDGEFAMVQDAIKRLLAERALDNTTTAASAAATTDFSAIDFDNTAGGVATLFPDYLPYNPTVCAYKWDVTGQVISQTCAH